MFLFEKYYPTNIRDLIYNRDIFGQLMLIASNDDIPHIIISGPQGGGKKILVNFFLESLYGNDVHNISKMKYNISGSSTKKEIEVIQSNYHIVIEPTNTNHDKYILQEIIKQYAMHKSFHIFKTNRKFKTIVIHNVENLANNSQAALRRTMELYAKTCRFVMICNNLSKIFEPLRSRCRIFCVPLPSMDDVLKVVLHISIMENIQLTSLDIKNIIEKCGNNIKKAIWYLDCKRLGCDTNITLEEVFDNIVKTILEIRPDEKNVSRIFSEMIRSDVYNILITNIKGSEIITTLLDKLIKEIDNDEIITKIIQHASNAEYNLVHGRRDIIHIDYFICGVIKELQNRY